MERSRTGLCPCQEATNGDSACVFLEIGQLR
jgi:hypothetical protein